MPSPTPRFRSFTTIASCLTLAAALTALPSIPAAAKNPSTAPAAAASTSDAEYERTGASPTEQNAATASASAARQNVRVEVLSERTATSRTWAVPEGGFVAEQYAGDVRFKDSAAFATQGWRDIDPGRTPGWRTEALGKGSKKGEGWMMRQYNDRGYPTGLQIRWHSGGGHHGGEPYWRVIGPNGDVGGIIR